MLPLKFLRDDKRLRIQHKLAGGFCLMLAMGTASYANMVHVMRASLERNKRVNSLVSDSVSLAKDIATTSHDTSSYTSAYLYSGKETYREFKWQADEDVKLSFQQIDATLRLLPGRRNIMIDLETARTQRMQICDVLEDDSIHWKDLGEDRRAQDLFETRSQPAQYRMEIDVNNLIDALNDYRRDSEEAETRATHHLILLGWIVQWGILFTSFLIALAIARATHKDIDNLLQTQKSLNATEDRLQTIVTGAPVVLFALDRDGVFTLSEGSGLNAIGRARGESIGHSLFERYRDNLPFLNQFQRALAGERFLELCQIGAVTFEVWYAPQTDLDGQIVGVLGVGTDVTARINAQAQVEALVQNLTDSNQELALAYDATIHGWSAALDLRDKETEGHSRRVTEMTIRIAQALGIDQEQIEHIRRGALLHDIGKMGIPDAILLKPDPLTEEEWEIMRRHPQYAYNFLSAIDFLRPALEIPLCHHERWDGAGYPRGLKGEEIPLSARIFMVVDVWDALSSDRPYRAAWPPERVKAHIQSLAGSHFDLCAVEVFLTVLAQDESSLVSAMLSSHTASDYLQAA